MGDANWWIPGWLDRLLPTIDIGGEAALPEPEMDPTLVAERVDAELEHELLSVGRSQTTR